MKMLGGKGALVLAIALGSITSFLVWQYTQQVRQAARPAETLPTVVVAGPIGARTVIQPEMVRVQSVPVDARHPNSYRTVAEVAGKVARVAMSPGEQVLSTRLYLQREESGLAFLVPEGMRAVSVAFTEVIGSGGLILPGDSVDVIGVFEARDGEAPQPPSTRADNEKTFFASLVLQDVEVLAVAQRMEGEDTRSTQTRLTQEASGSSARAASGSQAQAANRQVRSQPSAQPQAKTATLAVAPSDALRLVLAEERGKIRLALRRSRDDSLSSAPALPLGALLRSSPGAPAPALSAGR